jgi:hypothetical protein
MATQDVLIPLDELKRLVTYSPLTGLFIAKEPRPPVRSGDVLGWRNPQGNYVCVRRRSYKANRLAWYYMTGEWPGDLHIDHINGCNSDDRWENLRICTNAENSRNTKLSKRNTSGHKGVMWYARHQKWTASIRVDRKLKYLGYFDDIQDAIAARQQAEIELFGEFSPLVCRSE